MNRVVLSKEERKAKKAWQRKLGTRVDIQTWRASSSFKKWLNKMEAGYHPNDDSRSWLAERGNLANNAREEDQRDIAAKMPGGKTNPVVPSTTSYRVRVRTTGTPAEGRLPTTRIPLTGLGFGGSGEGISITSSVQGGTTSFRCKAVQKKVVQKVVREVVNKKVATVESKGTPTQAIRRHVDTEIASADNNSNTNTEKPTTDTNRFSMVWDVCDRIISSTERPQSAVYWPHASRVDSSSATAVRTKFFCKTTCLKIYLEWRHFIRSNGSTIRRIGDKLFLRPSPPTMPLNTHGVWGKISIQRLWMQLYLSNQNGGVFTVHATCDNIGDSSSMAISF